MADHLPGFSGGTRTFLRLSFSYRELLSRSSLGRSGFSSTFRSGISRSGFFSGRSSFFSGRSSFFSSRSFGRSLSRLATAGGQSESRENSGESELRIHVVYPKKVVTQKIQTT